MTIPTPHDTITMLSPSDTILQSLNTLLPFGLMSLREPINGANYGFVMAKGRQEVMCLKQQSVERSREDAELLFQLHHFIIMEAYTLFRAHHYSGAYLASPYLRQRDNELWESGIGHFIFPSKDGPEVSAASNFSTYDRHFGKGATVMLTNFILDMRECYKDKPYKETPTIGLDLRPRSHLSHLAMYFMLAGSQVFCLRPNLREQDPAWAILANAGIKEVVHLPCLPMEVG